MRTIGASCATLVDVMDVTQGFKGEFWNMELRKDRDPGASGAATSDRSSGKRLVVCVGETMAQVAPSPSGPLAEARELSLNFAGAESTVALYLAHFGHDVAWVSRLGEDPFGRMIESALNQSGVDTRWVEHDRERPTGVYFKDPAPGGTTVHYYRAGAAASAMDSGFLPPGLLEQSRLIHITGITPALSEACRALTEQIFALRSTYGYEVSFDVNYRPRLWTGRDAPKELLSLASAADVVFVGLDEAQELWATPTPSAVRDLLPGPAELVIKDGDVGATLFTRDSEHFQPAQKVEVLEPVGAGDSFAAGYLHERLTGNAPADRLRAGHRLAAAVLQTTADFVAPEEIAHVPEH